MSVSNSTMSASTYVVTGAARGIGAQWIEELSQREPNATVIALVRNPETASALKSAAARPNVHLVKGDITDQKSVDDAASEIGRLSGGKVDVLINNAAIGLPGKPTEQCPLEEYTNLFNVNVIGTIRMTLAILPFVRASSGKTIINTSSFLGSNQWTLSNITIPFAPYSVAKAALNMYSTKLAKELGPEGFKIISLSPGYVSTDMNAHRGHLSPFESVDSMLKVLNGLTSEDNGKFYNHDGSVSAF